MNLVLVGLGVAGKTTMLPCHFRLIKDAFLDELTKAVQELQTLLEELQDFFQQIEAMKSHVEDESCRSRLESWQMKLIEIIKEELLTLGE